MPQLLAQIQRFKAWAAMYPVEGRSGEWECGYPDWDLLYAAVLELVERKPFGSWSPQELDGVLYTVARDNETQHLSREICVRKGELLLDLAEASLVGGEPEAKWQIAEELGRVDIESARREQLLLRFARDGDEYVRRRSLGALARRGSLATERVALEQWALSDLSQQWARMMALWALHRVSSPRLQSLLAQAERDERPYLADYAARMRRGEVEP